MQNREIYELHAEVCKALSNPIRLQILNMLQKKELTVSEIVNMTGSLKSNVSQHLAILKRIGILSSRRSGKKVFYRINDTRIIDACTLMRDFLASKLEKSSKLLQAAK